MPVFSKCGGEVGIGLSGDVEFAIFEFDIGGRFVDGEIEVGYSAVGKETIASADYLSGELFEVGFERDIERVERFDIDILCNAPVKKGLFEMNAPFGKKSTLFDRSFEIGGADIEIGVGGEPFCLYRLQIAGE